MVQFLAGFKTYLGIALAVIGGLAGTLDVEAAAELPGWVDQALVVVGGLVAFFGRWARDQRGN
ncbi:MAG: hypothetical protein LC687_07705 [Actinobacteria bacterium]|nr:hypothetical protein [Actinomycetota bacterium]MCA1807716.1 hypothetical protein [Actinomycetota bacterium]